MRKMCVLIFLICCFFATKGWALSLTASAYDSPNAVYPIPLADQNENNVDLVNGDFTMIQAGQNSSGDPSPGDRGYMVGDGINESTDWLMDFTQDSDYDPLNPLVSVSSAEFTLKFIPMGLPDENDSSSDFYSDKVRIKWLENVSVPDSFPPEASFVKGQEYEITFDLFHFFYGDTTISQNRWYTSENILFRLYDDNGTAPGTFGMRYIADAYITEAHLTLTGSTAQPVPEPASILLFGAGLAGLAGVRTRQKK